MTSTTPVELIAMSDLPDYRISKEDVDPRGWNVVDSNGVPIGTASDLIIDLQGLIARYIVCSVSRGTAREVLIPTGFARLESESCTVHLDFVTALDIEGMPTHIGLPLSDEFSARMETAITGTPPAAAADEPKIVRRNQ
jgi:hypothetical protein